MDKHKICWTKNTKYNSAQKRISYFFFGESMRKGTVAVAGSHAHRRAGGGQTGRRARGRAGRQARTHAGGQAGGQTPADPLLNTGTLEDTHTANPRPRWIVPG